MSVARQTAVQVETYSSSVVQISPIRSIGAYRKPRVYLSPLQKVGVGLVGVAVVFVAFQAIRCGVISGHKIEGLLRQQAVVQSEHQAARVQKTQLQDKISLYSSSLGIEEMARERLDMVREDEILVRLYPQSLAQQ